MRFNGLGRRFVAGVGSELVFEGPAPDAGAVGFKVEAAEQFAGGGAVRGRGFGGNQFGEQVPDGGRPVGMMIAAGEARRPELGLALGAGAQVVAIKLVKTGAGQTQFVGGIGGREFLSAMASQEVTDKRSG